MGAVFGFFGVVLGAFGGHALKEKLTERALEIYQIGVHYQMIHALVLIALGIWSAQNQLVNTGWVGWSFSAGILLFSGSLYVLALTDLKFIGFVTPFGGVLFLLGWLGFAYLANLN